jgi:hypothetical protein
VRKSNHRSRGALIFVHQSAQPIPAKDGQPAREDLIFLPRPSVRWREIQAPVSPMAIVMINEHCENALEVSRVQNQQPIEALRTSGPDESFGDPIRLRCLNRRANDAYASALEHLNKAPREICGRYRATENEPAPVVLRAPTSPAVPAA